MSSRNPGGYRSGGKVEFARGLSLAFEFAGAVFLFWLLGRLVDNWLGTEPVAQIIGALLGWLGGFLHVYYATKSTSTRPGTPARLQRQGAGPRGPATKDDETSPTTGSEGIGTGK